MSDELQVAVPDKALERADVCPRCEEPVYYVTALASTTVLMFCKNAKCPEFLLHKEPPRAEARQ